MHEACELIKKFICSRRQGLSPRTIDFYEGYLCRANEVVRVNATGQEIISFIHKLPCTNGGRHAYYRALRAFFNWLYSSKSGYELKKEANPILSVEAPKVEKKILPSRTIEEVVYLVNQARSLRDKACVSLLADSGLRLNELANINAGDINWCDYTVTVWGKGGKQRKAPFTERTAQLLKAVVSSNGAGENIWNMKPRGIQAVLQRLERETNLKCNAHTFRRTFASNLHRAGLDIEHIMRLGGWESLDMVLRYTRSVKFEESLEHYRRVARESK